MASGQEIWSPSDPAMRQSSFSLELRQQLAQVTAGLSQRAADRKRRVDRSKDLLCSAARACKSLRQKLESDLEKSKEIDKKLSELKAQLLQVQCNDRKRSNKEPLHEIEPEVFGKVAKMTYEQHVGDMRSIMSELEHELTLAHKDRNMGIESASTQLIGQLMRQDSTFLTELAQVRSAEATHSASKTAMLMAKDLALQKLSQLVIQGDFDQVRQLANADLVRATDSKGRTVLMLAADADRTPVQFGKCIEYFLHLGADPSEVDGAGNTAAHVAARRNHLRMLALLPFKAKWLPNADDCSPLMEAVKAGSWQCAVHLLHICQSVKKSDIKPVLLGMRNGQGKTALEMAEESGQADLATVISRGLRLRIVDDLKLTGLSEQEVEVRDELHRLVESRDLPGLLQLATRANCDLPDADGRTALSHAIEQSPWDTIDCVQFLVTLGADVTSGCTLGDKCLHYAAIFGSMEAAKILLQAGAPVNDAANIGKQTPLMLASKMCVYPVGISCILLDAGASWEMKNADGDTAVDLADDREDRGLFDVLNYYEHEVFYDKSLKPYCCRSTRDSLRCLAAESVARLGLPTDNLPVGLARFVRQHDIFNNHSCVTGDSGASSDG